MLDASFANLSLLFLPGIKVSNDSEGGRAKLIAKVKEDQQLLTCFQQRSYLITCGIICMNPFLGHS
eukprot:611290-Pelagomonas_calceolata.AAC.3